MKVRELEREPPADVLAIVLFGSVARGDDDESSDVDIFLLVDDVPYERLMQLQEWCATAFVVPTQSVSAYSAQISSAMAASGALLLWHLKLEGRVLFDKSAALEEVFKALQPFSAYRQELDIFRELAEDVALASRNGRGPTELDLHVLQLVVRNVCILLTVYFGKPTFGRISAVEEAKRLSPALPVDLTAYRELCAWHLLFLRGSQLDSNCCRIDRFREYLSMTRSLLAFTWSLTC